MIWARLPGFQEFVTAQGAILPIRDHGDQNSLSSSFSHKHDHVHETCYIPTFLNLCPHSSPSE